MCDKIVTININTVTSKPTLNVHKANISAIKINTNTLTSINHTAGLIFSSSLFGNSMPCILKLFKLVLQSA